LSIAVLGALGAILFGVPLGLVAGYYRGFFSEVLMRLSDIVQSFPVFLLGMALVVVTGQDIKNVIYVVAAINCPIYVRLVRSEVLFLRERPFVEAARALGGRDHWIVREHIFPNSIGPVVAKRLDHDLAGQFCDRPACPSLAQVWRVQLQNGAP